MSVREIEILAASAAYGDAVKTVERLRVSEPQGGIKIADAIMAQGEAWMAMIRLTCPITAAEIEAETAISQAHYAAMRHDPTITALNNALILLDRSMR